MDQIESALVIQLQESIKWSSALPPLNLSTGTLTGIDPGLAFDVTKYARRDREFQHRDMVNAAAVAKVSIYARTVWAGTVVAPILQGVTNVTDYTGTNVTLPLDLNSVRYPLPIATTKVTYELNQGVLWDSVNVTDRDLYSRDLLLFETLARAASIFPNNPPIISIDPSMTKVSSTSVWATAQGVETPVIPNSASDFNLHLVKDPDLYLAQRDNDVAAYVSRVCQALKNPFNYASRVYVSVVGADVRESETYVLTNNLFQSGQVYAAGEQVSYQGNWYQALNTTSDIPPSANWQLLPLGPTLRQFLCEPVLNSRNKLVYDSNAKTLQWTRETLDTIHVPQIVGFLIPGILPGQQIQTVAAIPEQKDAQFYRQKAARVCFTSGTWSNEQVIAPTVNQSNTVSSVTGGIATVFQENKDATLMIPDRLTANFLNIICTPGTYMMNCLVRPSTVIEVAGGDNQQGSVDVTDGGVDFIPVSGTTFNWQVPLPAGGWQLVLEFANHGTAATTAFPVRVTQNGAPILSNALPLYYTDALGNPLPQFTVADSQPISFTSSGQDYNFAVTWANALANSGQQFHVTRLKFISTDGHDSSHYIMQATWRNAQGIGLSANSYLDVYGQHDMPDVMPFLFYVGRTDTAPIIDIRWVPKTAASWQARAYSTGDQVIYNLIYWQAIQPTTASDVPGQSALWTELTNEPQLPIIFEQVQLQKLISTTVTPQTQGFEGFRQDMLERALRADQDAYRASLNASGTNFPEFRSFGSIWDTHATGSWMRFLETFAPRLRQIDSVTTIVTGRQYRVVSPSGDVVVYNGGTYSDGQAFFGVSAASSFTTTGAPVVRQIGAYTVSKPGDLGKTGLIPAGLEYNQSAGTVTAWYPSYASFPTHQAVQPWMIEQGLYVAQNDFLSPDGNVYSAGTIANPPLILAKDFFAAQTYTHNDYTQNGATVTDGIVYNVITLSGVLPANPLAIAQSEIDMNSVATPIILRQALTCTIRVHVNTMSGGDPASYSYAWILQDTITSAVYLNISAAGVPPNTDYIVNLPAGASVTGSFAVLISTNATSNPGSVNITVTLGA